MKLFLLALLLGLPLAVSARIGDTRDTAALRYGQPDEINFEGTLATYKKSGFTITCTFFEHRCESVIYFKEDTDNPGKAVPLTDVEMEYLRDINGDGKSWKEKGADFLTKAWETEDLVAYTRPIKSPAFRVMTKAQMLREAAKQAAKEKANLEGL